MSLPIVFPIFATRGGQSVSAICALTISVSFLRANRASRLSRTVVHRGFFSRARVRVLFSVY